MATISFCSQPRLTSRLQTPINTSVEPWRDQMSLKYCPMSMAIHCCLRHPPSACPMCEHVLETKTNTVSIPISQVHALPIKVHDKPWLQLVKIGRSVARWAGSCALPTKSGPQFPTGIFDMDGKKSKNLYVPSVHVVIIESSPKPNQHNGCLSMAFAITGGSVAVRALASTG